MTPKLLTLFFLAVIYTIPLFRSLPDQTRPLVQSFLFRVFRNPGDKAISAAGGRLFYKQDVRYLIEPVDLAQPRAAIQDFRQQLAARGIRLIVLPIPVKPNTAAPAPFADLDLLSTLRNHYLAYDTHWTCQGAELAAKAVADRLRDLTGSTEYSIKPITVQRQGDIARMTNESLFPTETIPCQQVQNYKDDPASPILVLGDSFLRIYQTDAPRNAGFISHLARELKTPLTTIVNDGGASTLVRQELARKPHLLQNKKVVIWEFVERDLRFGTEGWQPVQLIQ